MKLADGIRKHGFRKWYERELLQSHAHLVLTFFCADRPVRRVRGARAVSAPGSDQVIDVVAIALCVAIGLWALRRYLYLLMHAEASPTRPTARSARPTAASLLSRERRDSSAARVLPQLRAPVDDQAS